MGRPEGPVAVMIDWTQRANRGRPHSRTDLALTAMMLVVQLSASTLGGEPDDRSLDVFAYFILIITAASTYFRRERPIEMLTLTCALGFSYWMLDYPNAGAVASMVVLLYSAAAHIENRRTSIQVLIAFSTAISVVFLLGYLSAEEQELSLGLIVANILLFQLSWLAGDSVRTRQLRVEELEASIKAAEAERLAQTQEAVANERNRIARELHDIVAHSMSVIVVQAEGASRLVGQDDESVKNALNAIGSTGRASLSDIRGIIGLLRTETDDKQPSPELSMLGALIDQCGEAGLEVELTVDGDERPLPKMVELSGYRIVQESLTNAIKHAGPTATASVSVRYEPHALRISIEDDGRGAAANGQAGKGHGLLGMRERVEAFGGDFNAGPRVGGGYAVAVTIPINA